MNIIIPDHDATMRRLAGLLLVRRVDVEQAHRPIDRRAALARLEGAADAVGRLLNAYGAEQVLTQVEAAFQDWLPQEGRASFDGRCQQLKARLFLLNHTENGPPAPPTH